MAISATVWPILMLQLLGESPWCLLSPWPNSWPITPGNRRSTAVTASCGQHCPLALQVFPCFSFVVNAQVLFSGLTDPSLFDSLVHEVTKTLKLRAEEPIHQETAFSSELKVSFFTNFFRSRKFQWKNWVIENDLLFYQGEFPRLKWLLRDITAWKLYCWMHSILTFKRTLLKWNKTSTKCRWSAQK